MAVVWKLIVVCITISLVAAIHLESEVFEPCVYIENRAVCYCDKDKLQINCSSQGLNAIPRIKFEFKVLHFRNNTLGELNKASFESIMHNENITKLDFSQNHITKIENDSLSVFRNLGSLDLSGNPISNAELKNGLFNISSTLKEINLSHLKLAYFDAEIFYSLRNCQIRKLLLQYNKFVHFNFNNFFTYLPKIIVLDLSNNYITDMNFNYSNTLRNLTLTRNEMVKFPRFCRAKKSIFPNLRCLYIDKNCMFSIPVENLHCLNRLQLLNISEVHMHFMGNNLFNSLTSLKVLSVDNSAASLDYIHRFAFNSSSLIRIDLRNNGLQFVEEHVSPEFVFSNCPNLMRLDLTGNFLGKMTDTQWMKMLKKLPKLSRLHISRVELNSLPMAVPFYLNNLVDFRAEYNEITEIPKGYFSHMRKVVSLYLNSNKISRIDEGELPKSLKVLNLGYNPYYCDCKLLWFLNFLKKNRKIVRDYPDIYKCTNGNLLSGIKISVKSCLFTNKTNTIITSSCFVGMVLVTFFSLIYHYRWRLRYVMHILTFYRRNYLFSRNQMFLHDVYIVCADNQTESAYIFDHLVKRIEYDAKRVFFPRRDALPNKPTVTGTLEQMDRSKCILICISDAFSSDQLCEFQVNMALQRSIHDSECTVIVVILEDVSIVNKTINSLLRTHQNYLLWDEEGEANALFWRKFNEYF